MIKYKRLPRKFELGRIYNIRFGHGNSVNCKFIKVTRKGYNFVNISTHKCVLKHHLYPSKCPNHLSENWFWINTYYTIKNNNDYEK